VALAAVVVRVGQATLQVVQEHQGKVLPEVRVVPITLPTEMQVAAAVLAVLAEVQAQAALLDQAVVLV
jgi:hypothetical protein